MFFPTRARGQNFLRDPVVAERFAAAALAPPDSPPAAFSGTSERSGAADVVEVGAGKGALTRPLLAARARVLAVEADSRLVEMLEARTVEERETGRLRLVASDALRCDFAAEMRAFGMAPPVPICGNLPFSAAAPLLLRLISESAGGGRPLFPTLTLSFQREVAQRIAARPGEPAWGGLAVVAQQAFVPRILFQIPPRAFRPRPRVVAAVVRFEPRPDPPPVGPEAHFRSLVRGLFAHRRKTLRNSLLRLPDPDLSERATAAAAALGLDPEARAETLDVDSVAALSRLAAPEPEPVSEPGPPGDPEPADC